MIRLSDSTRRRIGFSIIAIAMAFALIGAILDLSADRLVEAAEMIILATAFGAVMTFAIRAVPRNGAVWTMIWAFTLGAAGQLGETLAFSRAGIDTLDIEEKLVSVAPSEIDTLAAVGAAFALTVWVPAVFLLANHLLILFPSGSAVSRRWRWAAWTSGLSMVAIVVPGLLATGPWVDRPYDVIYASDMAPSGIFSVLLMVPMAIAVAAVVHLIRRYRRSSGEERLQYRWVTWSLLLQVLSIFSYAAFSGTVGTIVGTIVLASIPLSFGIAITKYRLYEIDVVINRSLVFAGLAGFITVIYVAIVVGLGSLFSGSDLWLSITATAVVAVVFEPVRARVQRWVNRLVYGSRATPYEVLSDLTGRLAATESDEGLLARMAQRLADGTGADRATVWLQNDGALDAAATGPANGEGRMRVDGVDALPGEAVPIEHEGEVLGALSVEKARGDALTPTERQLIEDLAGSAGLVIRRLRLDEALAAKAEQLVLSRRRLLDAQDVERRRLERDLHDGAQQHVVALRSRIEAVASLAAAEEADQAVALLRQLCGDAEDAIDQIRSLSQGIYPPLLERGGLEQAIPAVAAQSPHEVRLDIRMTSRHPLQMEGAVYFCLSEALTNAAKHAEGPITVIVNDADAGLSFSVTDSGPGFDTVTVASGAGLANMADRLDALGGSVRVTSAPGKPTVVTGGLPVGS